MSQLAVNAGIYADSGGAGSDSVSEMRFCRKVAPLAAGLTGRGGVTGGQS